MSKIENIKEEMGVLIKNISRIPDEFLVKAENDRRVIWLLDREDGTAGDYETSQERLGITKEGEIVWGFSSGCSCWDGWKSGDYCPTMSYKEFIIKEDLTSKKGEYGKEGDGFVEGWEDESLNNIDSFLLLIQDNPKPKDILKITNAEIRRYLIKRVGYENIKESVKAEVIHRDGTSELLKFNNGEMYVKVKDSSTEREYLLFVDGNTKTCKQAIAWTFGLREDEYNPLVET